MGFQAATISRRLLDLCTHRTIAIMNSEKNTNTPPTLQERGWISLFPVAAILDTRLAYTQEKGLKMEHTVFQPQILSVDETDTPSRHMMVEEVGIPIGFRCVS